MVVVFVTNIDVDVVFPVQLAQSVWRSHRKMCTPVETCASQRERNTELVLNEKSRIYFVSR